MRLKYLVAGAAAAALTVSLAACGGGSNGSNGSTGGNGGGGGNATSTGGSSNDKPGGTLKLEGSVFPDSLDPDFGYTTQAQEADTMVYIPLLTYAEQQGTAGTQLIPGAAESLPQVSSDGLTYTLTLRKGLKFSDGSPVVASDFTLAVERSVRLPWGGASFLTGYIKGAADYADKKASSISGITTDNSTGKITIQLTQKYGAFPNVLAFVQTAPIPANTPFKVLSNTPPLGDGPYKFGKIVANQSYVLQKNPNYVQIPGISAGYVDEIDMTVQSNPDTEAQDVINNTADVFDPADTITGSALATVQQDTSRYAKIPSATTYYFFMDVTQKPFNNQDVREAVNMALDRPALSKLSGGSLTPGAFFLPPTIAGHTDGGYPWQSNVNASPSAATIAKAKNMVKAAGLANYPVTVWSQTKQPRQNYDTEYTRVLNEIGLKATLKVVADATYFQQIGNANNHAQTGFADWSQDFPNPSDFYLLLDARSIQPVNNENFGNVNDAHIQQQLKALEPIPATQLSSAAPKWQALDKYVAQKAYVAVFGYETLPKFFSDRVDFNKAIVNPVDYLLFNTVELTQ